MSNHITNTYNPSARLLKAMAHPVRLAILDILLKNEEECVCHLEAVLGYRQAYLSQHLMALREAGLVDDRRDGRNIFYSVSQPRLAGLLSTIREELGPRGEIPRVRSAACVCPKCARAAQAEALGE